MAHHDDKLQQEVRELKRDAQETAQDVKAQAQDVARTAKSQAQDIAQDVKADAQEMAQQAQQEADSYVDQQTNSAARQLDPITNALRQTGQQLEEQNTPFAQYAMQAADQVEMVQNYLQGANLDQIAKDARKLAHEQPELFVGAAFTAGLMLARFFKSSAPANQNSQPRQYNQGSNYAQPTHYSREYVDRMNTPTVPPYQQQQARLVPTGERRP